MAESSQDYVAQSAATFLPDASSRVINASMIHTNGITTMTVEEITTAPDFWNPEHHTNTIQVTQTAKGTTLVLLRDGKAIDPEEITYKQDLDDSFRRMLHILGIADQPTEQTLAVT